MGKRAHKGFLARVDLPLPATLASAGAASSGGAEAAAVKSHRSAVHADGLRDMGVAVRGCSTGFAIGSSSQHSSGPSRQLLRPFLLLLPRALRALS